MKPTLLAIAVLFCSTQAAFAFQAGPPPGSEWKRDRSDRELIAEFAPKLALLDKNPGTQAVLKKLDEPVAVNFPEGTSFEDVIKFYRSATQGSNDSGIPIYLDPEAIAEIEAPNQTVKIDLDGIALKTTLRLILKQVGLAYCVKDGMIFVSTPEGVVDELREFEAEILPIEERQLIRPRKPAAGMGMQ